MKKRGDNSERAALGRRLRIVVETYGTQERAAQVARVSTEQVRRIMNGTNVPSALVVTRLAKGAPYTLDWVLTGTGDRRHQVIASDETTHLRAENEALKQALAAYQKLLELKGC